MEYSEEDLYSGKIKPAHIPQNWQGRALKSGKGWCWYDPNSNNNAIFIYKGTGEQGSYVIVVKNGLQLDRNGEPIPGTSIPND